MRKKMIIAIGYKKGSGKTTFAKMLRAYLHAGVGRGYRRVDLRSFAGPLKRHIGMGIFGLTYQQMTDPVLKERPLDEWWGLSPRQILQRAGTEGLRAAIHQDVWVKAALRDLDPWEFIVFDDLRFPNEAEVVRSRAKDLGWESLICKVERKVSDSGDGVDVHASETALDGWDGWDLTIKNEGDLQELQDRAYELAKMVISQTEG